MAPQTVPAAKRYRISFLLDIYSELLTEKQRTFLRHYFEEDLSFGEIAKEYGVSRQAIFDSVKHGEEALENFERVLKLVESGWGRWVVAGQTTETLAARLAAIRAQVAGSSQADLDLLIAELRGEAPEDDEPAAELEPAAGGNGLTHV